MAALHVFNKGRVTVQEKRQKLRVKCNRPRGPHYVLFSSSLVASPRLGFSPLPVTALKGKLKLLRFSGLVWVKMVGMNWAVRPGDAALDSNTGVFPSEASLRRVSCRPDFHRKERAWHGGRLPGTARGASAQRLHSFLNLILTARGMALFSLL